MRLLACLRRRIRLRRLHAGLSGRRGRGRGPCAFRASFELSAELLPPIEGLGGTWKTELPTVVARGVLCSICYYQMKREVSRELLHRSFRAAEVEGRLSPEVRSGEFRVYGAALMKIS